MKIICRLNVALLLSFLLSHMFLLAPNSGRAMTSTCSWYVGDQDAPWIYAVHSYDSFEAGFGNMVDLFTVMTSPIFATASDYYNINPGGNTHGHETMASLGPYYYHQSEMAIGMHAPYENQFTPVIWTNCDGGFQFDVPSVSVVVTPPVVTVGDLVTIVWGSSNANMCIFDNAPIATNGSQSFTAALVDSRPYTLECQNEWGWASHTATLLVNAPGPNCPPYPTAVTGFSYPYPREVSPGDEFGLFAYSDPDTDLEARAYCTDDHWKVRLTKADIGTKYGFDLHELIEADLSNNSCTDLSNMVASLNYHSAYSSSFGRNTAAYPYWMLNAIKAHELVHYSKFQEFLNADFFNIVNEVHSIEIPLSSASDEWGALEHPAMQSAITDAHDSLIDAINLSLEDANHESDGGLVPWAEFTSASEGITGPMVASIINKMQSQLMCSF